MTETSFRIGALDDALDEPCFIDDERADRIARRTRGGCSVGEPSWRDERTPTDLGRELNEGQAP